MKERPILFSGPMVRALLDGSKTQTRRVVNAKHLPWVENSLKNFLDGKWDDRPMPCGKPGDHLWVREAWRSIPEVDKLPPRELTQAHRIWYEADAPHQPGFGKLRPSMFMPRWASRITLEITAVRIERMQDISEADARAEGCGELIWDGKAGPAELIDWPLKSLERPYANDYALLWESINGDGTWAANPYVWVIEFRRVKP